MHYCRPNTPLSLGWTTDDRQRVYDLAEIRTGDTQELEAYVTWLHIRTEGLVASWQTGVASPALANTRLARRELTGVEALAVMQEAIQSPIRAHTMNAKKRRRPARDTTHTELSGLLGQDCEGGEPEGTFAGSLKRRCKLQACDGARRRRR